MHEGKKPFECELCDSKFMTRPKPNMHIDALHEGKKRFDCKDCGVKFTQKKSIKIHVPHCKGKQDHMCPYHTGSLAQFTYCLRFGVESDVILLDD